jgi:hypothetical protein
VNREVHARFCESRGARFPPATHLRISLARLSSAFSFFNALSWADSSVVVPGRWPASISCCFTQFRSVSREPMPSFSATAYKAAVSFG